MHISQNFALAKSTLVNHALVPAFAAYGGNRHGFLAFSEIQPDHSQIPHEDREALLREEAEHAAEEERLRAAEFDSEEADEIYDPEDEEAAEGEDGNGDETAEAGTGSNR